jgi:hypothetical protein
VRSQPLDGGHRLERFAGRSTDDLHLVLLMNDPQRSLLG